MFLTTNLIQLKHVCEKEILTLDWLCLDALDLLRYFGLRSCVRFASRYSSRWYVVSVCWGVRTSSGESVQKGGRWWEVVGWEEWRTRTRSYRLLWCTANSWSNPWKNKNERSLVKKAGCHFMTQNTAHIEVFQNYTETRSMNPFSKICTPNKWIAERSYETIASMNFNCPNDFAKIMPSVPFDLSTPCAVLLNK